MIAIGEVGSATGIVHVGRQSLHEVDVLLTSEPRAQLSKDDGKAVAGGSIAEALLVQVAKRAASDTLRYMLQSLVKC